MFWAGCDVAGAGLSNMSEIRVFPAAALQERKRLFDALQQAFPVSFTASPPKSDKSDQAAISFIDPGNDLADHPGSSRLLLPAGPEAGLARKWAVRLANDSHIDRAFRGRTLSEHNLGHIDDLRTSDRTTVLATAVSKPIWCRHRKDFGDAWQSALAIPELMDGECLRDRFRDGSFASMLPLVHFLKSVASDAGWKEPALRAAFIVDDPNLHSLRYGYLRFPELAQHAERHDYHVAMATIPLDAWFTHRGAADIFRKPDSRLSLLIHGNNHVHHELAEFQSQKEAMSCLAQALRRVRRFEAKKGVPVCSVIAPPHGACSELAMETMLRLGYEGICVSRPFPWLQRPPGDTPTAGWFPADLVAGGLPVIPRYHLSAAREDLAFRAFLGQPLVLYGHHDDARSGLEVFSSAAEEIGRFGDVRWESLGKIARSNYTTRRSGNCMQVRCYTNNFSIDIPDGVVELEVTTAPAHGLLENFTVAVNGEEVAVAIVDSGNRRISARVPVSAGKTVVSLRHQHSVTAESVPEPAWHAWSAFRRVLTETRDRVRPAFARH